MADYGYLIYSSDAKRDIRSIELIFSAVSCENIYLEKDWFSPASRRVVLEDLLEKLSCSDNFFVHGMDRLGNDPKEAVRTFKRITGVKRSNIIFLDYPNLDTRLCPPPETDILKYVANKAFENLKREDKEALEEENIGIRQAEVRQAGESSLKPGA
jgi:hypothetical protein